jgi:hypothetical protein
MVEAIPNQENTNKVSKKTVGKTPAAKKLKINTSDASHVIPLLERLCSENASWQQTESKTECTLRWVHPAIDDEQLIEWLNKGPMKMVNRYPDIKTLAHKDVFGEAMRFCMDLDSTCFDFIPPTFSLPSNSEMNKFTAYKEAHKNATFIAKP